MTDCETEKNSSLYIWWSLLRTLLFFLAIYLQLVIVSFIFERVGVQNLNWLGAYFHSLSAIIVLACSIVAILIAQIGLPKQAKSLGLKADKATIAIDLLHGILAGAVFVSIVIFFIWMFGGYQIDSINYNIDVMPLMVMFLIGAFTEELVFRGFLFQLMEKSTSTFKALLIVSILFGYAHIINPVEGVGIIEKVVACGFLALEAGIPLTLAFLLTRSLWFATGIHFAWNFFEGAIYGANVSGKGVGHSFIDAKLTAGISGGGGAFGPEGTLVCLMVGILFSIVLYRLLSDKEKTQLQKY